MYMGVRDQEEEQEEEKKQNKNSNKNGKRKQYAVIWGKEALRWSTKHLHFYCWIYGIYATYTAHFISTVVK